MIKSLYLFCLYSFFFLGNSQQPTDEERCFVSVQVHCSIKIGHSFESTSSNSAVEFLPRPDGVMRILAGAPGDASGSPKTGKELPRCDVRSHGG